MARMIITYNEKHHEEFTIPDPDPDKVVEDPFGMVVEAMENGTIATFKDTGWSNHPAMQPLVKVNGKLVRSVRLFPV